MLQSKIFFGTVTDTADNKLNDWIRKHPCNSIIQFKYIQSRYCDHSICILYETSRMNNLAKITYRIMRGRL